VTELRLIAPEGAESFRAEAQADLAACREALEAILAAGTDRTSDEVLVQLDDLYLRLSVLYRSIAIVRSVHPDVAVREAAEECEQEVARFDTEVGLNRDLFEAVQSCDPSGLDAIGKRLVERMLRDFRRAGVDRDDAVRDRVREIRAELVRSSQEFSRNIVTDVRSIELDGVEELAGLPDDYVRSHPADDNGKIRITTDYPDYNPFMQYGESGVRREELYRAFRCRGYPPNMKVLASILERRHELATLLGYPHWADYVAEDKMVRTASHIGEFIERVSQAADGRSRREYDQLLERKRHDVPDAGEVHDWEKTRYEELIKAESYSVDSRDLRPYFSYEATKNGIFEIASEMFGVEFRAAPSAPAWHEDVEVLDVLEGGHQVGRVYLDKHPRDGKFKHAAMFPLVSGVRGRRTPAAALICNFKNPRTSDGPALLDHDDVVTFFHEFGHLLHHLFSRDHDWVEFSGTGTEWDFVEVPSQLMEEWAWDAEVLQRFARHHETGEVIPADLVDRLRRADFFGKGLQVRQQMYYASLSLRCHREDPASVDLERFQIGLQNHYSRFRYVDGTHFIASFGHLDGYSALYYTYMWSLVIEKDLAEVFKARGWMDAQTAARYRETILSQGGVRDAADLVTSFLGREYEFDAFERWLDGVEVS